MYAEIVKLEDVYNSLLPDQRLNQSPSKELLEAAKAWSEEVWKVSKVQRPLQLTNEQISSGESLIQHPVFICGVHRSGTTLLRDLLDGHPSLSVLPSEGSFLTNLATRLKNLPAESAKAFLVTEWLRRLANPINQPPYWLLGRSNLKSSAYVNFVRACNAWHSIAEKTFSQISMWPHFAIVLAYAASQESKENFNSKYWVDKTPTNEKYLERIWREMPEAKIIHIVRNPVDVFLSRKRMDASLNSKGMLKDLELSYKTAILQSALNQKNYLLIHYEELCENPQVSMARITQMLNIEDHPCLFTPTIAGQLAKPNSSFNANLPAGRIIKEINNAETLSSKESKLLSAYLFQSATQLGYSLKPISKIQSSLVKLNLT